jgi:hypothetical protein
MIHLIAIASILGISQQDHARSMIEQAMNVLGGRKKLESIRQLTVSTAGNDFLVEQSERPTGPFLHSYNRGPKTYDFDQLSESAETTMSGLVYGPNEIKRTYKIEKGIGRASSPTENALSYRRLALGPERALLHAASAPDLSLGKEITFNGIPHQVVQFKWGNVPVRLFLKKGTLSPSAIETTSTLPFPWSVWGDVPITTRWGNWQALENGIMEPGQFTTEINGYPASDVTILSAKLTLSPGTAVLAQPLPLAKDDSLSLLARYKAVKVLGGIVQYQGPFNTFVVEQPDGLVVIEPVMNPAFATAFLDRLTKDFPGKRVKAVVATDDAWPHFGGIRTFVARGAELVILDLNRPIVQRFCDSQHLTNPDELATHPTKPKFKLVSKPTTLGSGPNQMVLYPIAGQGSERMMMAYFPAHRLLYGSDLLQKTSTGFFFPSYPKELVEAVIREKLNVETVFAEHLAPTPWKTVSDFVTKTIGGA